jgi:hypothetical protein
MTIIMQILIFFMALSCGKDERAYDLRLKNRTLINSKRSDGTNRQLDPENGQRDANKTAEVEEADSKGQYETKTNPPPEQPTKDKSAVDESQDRSTVNPSPSKSEPKSLANLRLLQYYSVKQNYDAVYKDVLSFYPTGRPNGCVAFLSTALRLSDTYIPRNKQIGGYNISLVTSAFSNYLVNTLGWNMIRDHKKLEPGDVVMTLPNSNFPDIPAHTYMFQSWRDKSNGIGMVIDNQNFTHERNIFGTGTFNFTPFWYALRAPASTSKLSSRAKLSSK